MKTTLFQIIFFLVLTNLYGQKTVNKVDFGPFLKKYKKSYYYSDTVKSPFLHIDRDYKVKLSDNPIYFQVKQINLQKPDIKKYPLSYSIIYAGRLISLFEPGIFRCYTVPDLKRDIEYENLINKKTFDYHWILENKLVARSENKFFFLSSDNVWLPYSETVPIKRKSTEIFDYKDKDNISNHSEYYDNNKSKYFEDENYLVFSDCYGEFGGTVYFYNKQLKKVFYTEATCVCNVYKSNNKYMVLSEIGHGFGSCDLKEISNPEKLPEIYLDSIETYYKGIAIGYKDKSGQAKTVFEYYNVQVYSSFNYNGRLLYLLNWAGNENLQLAELKDNTFEILTPPLFNSEVYLHSPLTTNYDGTILINHGHYMTALDREVSFILIRDEHIVKINWD
jgi:hypothetical protein